MSSGSFSPDAVRRLADPRARRYLGPFLARECTVTTAATELGVSLAAMWQQTQRLLACGLLVETRREARRGRPVRYYRSTRDSFDVPVRELPQESVETILEVGDRRGADALRAGLVKTVMRGAVDADEIVLHIRRLPGGAIDAAPALAGGGELPPLPAAAWSSWTYLRLSDDEAAQLQQELMELWRRWAAVGEAAGGRTHILRLAAAPT